MDLNLCSISKLKYGEKKSEKKIDTHKDRKKSSCKRHDSKDYKYYIPIHNVKIET